MYLGFDRSTHILSPVIMLCIRSSMVLLDPFLRLSHFLMLTFKLLLIGNLMGTEYCLGVFDFFH